MCLETFTIWSSELVEIHIGQCGICYCQIYSPFEVQVLRVVPQLLVFWLPSQDRQAPPFWVSWRVIKTQRAQQDRFPT